MDYKDFVKKAIQLFIGISSPIFIIIILILFLTMWYIFIFIIIEYFLIIVFQYNSLTSQNFISITAKIIEFALFEVVLFLLANGIYVYILKATMANKDEKDFSLGKMLNDFIEYLSRPFLMTIASMLIVSSFEIFAEMFEMASQIPISTENLSSYVNYKLFQVLFIFVIILMISLLLYIEKSTNHSIPPQNKI